MYRIQNRIVLRVQGQSGTLAAASIEGGREVKVEREMEDSINSRNLKPGEFSTMRRIKGAGKTPVAGTTNLLHFNIQPPLLALRASSEKSVSHGSHGNCTNTDGRPSFRFRRDSCEDLVSRPGSADERTLSLLFRPRIDRPRSHSLPLTPVPMLRCCLLNFFPPQSWWLMFTAKSNCKPV